MIVAVVAAEIDTKEKQPIKMMEIKIKKSKQDNKEARNIEIKERHYEVLKNIILQIKDRELIIKYINDIYDKLKKNSNMIEDNNDNKELNKNRVQGKKNGSKKGENFKCIHMDRSKTSTGIAIGAGFIEKERQEAFGQ